jgi:uncharacterized membrane protein YcaP (DUF421 family)
VNGFWEEFIWLVGIDQQFDQISVWQVVARTIVVYLLALLIIRLGKRRFMGNFSAVDILLGFVVGSIMSRGITGSISILNMLVVLTILFGLHWGIATISYHWKGFANTVDNDPRDLISDGEVDKDAMKKSKITQAELDRVVREKGHVESADEVRSAKLEPDGAITVITKEESPHDDPKKD